MHPRMRMCGSFLGLLLFGLAGATSVLAQVGIATASPTTSTSSPTATVVEWDTPSDLQSADTQPGAITADLYGNSSGSVWFTTRIGNPPRVYQFQPPANYKYGSAQMTSWPIGGVDGLGAGPTGGLKRVPGSFDRRFIFVRTMLAVVKIDTLSNTSTTYCDDALAGADQSTICSAMSPVSDVASDNKYFVYYTYNGYLQRLDTSSNSCTSQQCPPVTATRWNLSSAGSATLPPFSSTAGNCTGNATFSSPDTDPCLSGVAVHPRYQNLVYVAEPDQHTIAEVNTAIQSCGCPTDQPNVRRWTLNQQPRQINFDQDGLLWIITGPDSTLSVPELISLDPNTNRITVYNIPAGTLQDSFGVAPDGGMVGYTANDQGGPSTSDPDPTEHKVGALIPQGQGTAFAPTKYLAQPNAFSLTPSCSPATPNSGPVHTVVRQVPAKIMSGGNGTFIEGLINRNSDGSTQKSFFPLGIAPAFKKAVGTFLYAVGTPDQGGVNRVGFIRLPRKGFKAKHEREDKDCNDDGTGKDAEDHDGIPDKYKTSDSKSKMDRQNDSLGPGQSMDYNLTTTSSTMALVAAIQSDNALEPVSVQVIDPNGITLALPIATPGLAVATVVPTAPGNYTIRVKNEGALPINPETQLITREPLSLP